MLVPLHEPQEGELRGLADLIERTARHDAHRPVGEHALIELKQGPRVFPHAAIAAWESGNLVGYAHLSERQAGGEWRLEAFTAPEHRGRGIGRALVDAAERHVASHGGGRIHVWALQPRSRAAEPGDALRDAAGADAAPDDASASRARGTTRGRRRPIVPCRRHPGLAGAPQRGVRRSPRRGWWREADLAWHLEESWFDPEGLLLAAGDRRLLGYCWMKLEGPVGWVYFLGVRPEARRAGLGAGLCLRGLDWASSRGAEVAHLYVDRDDEHATALYERLGFSVDHLDVGYRLDVRAAPGGVRGVTTGACGTKG